MSPSLTLAPLPGSETGRVLHLELPDHQEPFVGAIAEMAADPDPAQDFHAVSANGQVIGFFKVDTDFSTRIHRLPTGAHGVRGILIGGQYQGHGYGRRFLEALPNYLKSHYPNAGFWLSVDQGNELATRLYLGTGWRVDGDPFEGRSGPEWVMRLDLP